MRRFFDEIRFYVIADSQRIPGGAARGRFLTLTPRDIITSDIRISIAGLPQASFAAHS